MRRCIEAHEVPGFGAIPVGSLWADGSPFLLDEHAGKFEIVPEVVDVPADFDFSLGEQIDGQGLPPVVGMGVDGGLLPPNGLHLVGEQGPETIIPDEGATVRKIKPKGGN